MTRPAFALHVAGGTVGLLAGTAALLFLPQLGVPAALIFWAARAVHRRCSPAVPTTSI
ncbi:MAG: hypothetical protein ACREV7_11645 [Steroidobacteraceae bacterium]